jgi:hypothetical protein
MLTATVTGSFLEDVYAGTTCYGKDIACSMQVQPATISFAVQGGQVVYVTVDGVSGGSDTGPFTLTLKLQ